MDCAVLIPTAVLWFAPSKLKLPMCLLIWAGLVFDLESYIGT